jgi:DNA-binding response OmpR family regulator
MAKILLIEDNDLLQKLYKGKLSDEGFEVTVASNGKMGLALVKDQRFDLIILDIILPGGINGFDVLEVLRQNEVLSKIPVIVLTNLESEEKVAREIGAVDYFVKTKVTLDQVVTRVNEVLRSEK